MKILGVVLTLILFLPLAARADDTAGSDPCTPLAVGFKPTEPAGKKPKKPKKGDLTGQLVPLSLVICEVQRALDSYQDDPDVKQGAIPKLLIADFDFKTVIDTKASFGISILVFKFGVSYDNQTTHDVDFQYEPKSLHKGGAEALVQQKDLQQELLDTIKAAAKAKVLEETLPKTSKDPLVFKQLSVTIAYGVTWDINVAAAIPISIVTLGPGIDHSKNSVQTVKLTFATPPKDSPVTTDPWWYYFP
jgi:hypothetical protein